MAAAGGGARLPFRVMVGTGLAAIMFAFVLHAVRAHAAVTVRTITRLLFHDELLVVRSSRSDKRVAYRQ